MWHIHTPHLNGAAKFARNYLKYAVYGRRADQILCVSPDLVDTITRRGAPRDKVEFIHNAVDTDRFPVLSAERRRAARERAGFTNGRKLLVHFGWDWPRKGGDLYSQALAKLRESGIAVAGVTVGGASRRASWPSDSGSATTSSCSTRPTTCRRCTRRRTCSWRPAAPRARRSRCWRRSPAGHPPS